MFDDQQNNPNPADPANGGAPAPTGNDQGGGQGQWQPNQGGETPAPETPAPEAPATEGETPVADPNAPKEENTGNPS